MSYQGSYSQARTNTLSMISWFLGFIGILMAILAYCTVCTLFISIVISPAATIMGFIAKKQIDDSAGQQTGRGWAIGGIITGLIGTVASLVVLVIILLIGGLTLGAGLVLPFLN